jgi:VWFA-related protein
MPVSVNSNQHFRLIPVKIALPILALIVPGSVRAQEGPTISTKVNVVSFLATVHDRDGKVVKNLTPDDFTLLEDGIPQKIEFFTRESDLPLTIGLLVDTSRSQAGVLEQERRASHTFLDQVLRQDKDQAFVVSFDTRVETLQGLTSSRSELEAALNRLSIPGEFATLIFSAVQKSSEDIMHQQPGRKAVILLTDGVAFRDPTSIGTAIEFAQRADTIIYAIRFSDSRMTGPVRAAVRAGFKERGKQGLQRMAKETGGISYEVAKDQSIEEIYSQIEEALRNQYSIGYTPKRQADDGKYHKIKLTTKDHHLVVAARDGYYAK